MLVREVMSDSPVTAPLGTTVQGALQVLARTKVTSLPVVSRRGRLVGIVSEADLIRDRVVTDPRLHEIPRGDDPAEAVDQHTLVDDVMTTHVVTVRPDTDLRDAVELLTSSIVKSVPVVDPTGRVLGMLSRSDVVAMLAHSDEDLEREVDAALTAVGLGSWWVRARDGVVELVPPEHTDQVTLARVVAGTVPGVTTVHVAPD